MNKKTFFWLAAILLFAVALRLIFFSGIGASDDLLYTRYAYEVSKNSYSFPNTHHGTRLGLIYPVSFLYKLFGVNEFSSNIFVFLTSVGGIVLIFYFGKIFFNEEIGLLSAFLLSFFPLDAVFATKLLSDLPSSFFLSLCILLFLLGERCKTAAKRNISYFFSGISIGAAYLIRETALLVVLFFALYALYYKRFKLNYFMIFCGFLIMFVLESVVYNINTGDPFYRYNSLTSNYEQVAKSSEFFGRGSFPFSVVHYPYLLFTSISLGLLYPFAFAALFYCLYFRRKETYPFMMWLGSLLLYLIFGTVSFSEYIPFAAVPRYLSIITFPSIILLAYFLSEREKVIAKVLKPYIVLLLLITSIGFVYLDKGSRESIANLREIYPHIEHLDKQIYADYRSASAIEYISGYSNKIKISPYKILENDDALDDLSNAKDSYVVVNSKMIKGIKQAHPYAKFDIPVQISDPPKEWVVVNEIGQDSDSTVVYYST